MVVKLAAMTVFPSAWKTAALMADWLAVPTVDRLVATMAQTSVVLTVCC
jgi:hypothetical protein